MRAYIPIVFLLLLGSCTNPKVYTPVSGLVPINNTELYIHAYGQGEPLLIVHGGPGLSHDYFLPHFDSLAKTNFLIFYDQRGTGRSSLEQDSSTMNLNTFVQDMDSIRAHFEIDEINILAHSWGNLLAVDYTLAHPEHVKRLILSNPGPLSLEYNEELGNLQRALITDSFLQKRQNIMSSDAFKSQEIGAYEDLFMLNFSLSFRDSTQLEKLNLNFQDSFLEGNQLLRSFTGLEDYNYYEQLDTFEKPVLLLRGRYDLALKEADNRAVETLKNGTLIEFNESGHFPFIEEVDRYTQVVNDFLRGNLK